MIRSRLLVALAVSTLALALAGCSGGADTPASEAAAGHFDGGIKVTHYTEATELFVEHRPLVMDKDRRFDAHLSWLEDYRAVTEGTLTAELVWPDGAIDRASAQVSDTPGIFRPLLRATRSGQARLRLVLDSRGSVDAHELGEVTVWATSEEGAAAAPAEEEVDGAIAFTKEVQWRVPFLAEAAVMTNMAEAIPVTIDVQMQPQAEAVISAPVDGIVRATRIPSPGMAVRRGQVIATISSTLGGGEDVATLDLSINEARIARDAAATEVRRMEALVEAEAVPQRRLDEARTQAQLAEARLRAAQSRRAALAGGGAGVPVVAPISGEVLETAIVQGQGVTGGQQLLRIGNPAALWLVARVPEGSAAQVAQPQGLEITLPGESLSLTAGNGLALVQGGAAIDPATRTLPVIFAWNSRQLRPGQRVQGQLLIGAGSPALTIAASAILNEGGQDVVYVQIAGETFQRRPVTVLRRSGDRVAVEGQLAAGERVVSQGASAVRAAASTPDAFGHGHAH
ncbi:efflux RND transporter periplasmic adaptor subunit [Altererythrobacter sp. KTW20L]|uniref:efflux RND transporter periplasmic adaptor subunit n=1 Tax=Altererythrobacter sp. KTW20L TaxID=2942210 RepID=UPI0020BE5065|nr:efflux RND transporter periplasmic adaptor subunit [Altererythrobacter sp. KTW20L]MCL6250453.1 efflux RND transporter periplasmic adaptor subunit [Altererythrobacter sp. KTW20L]